MNQLWNVFFFMQVIEGNRSYVVDAGTIDL